MTLQLAVRETTELAAIEEDPNDPENPSFVIRLVWNLLSADDDLRERRIEQDVALLPPFDTISLGHREIPIDADASATNSAEFVSVGNLRPIRYIRVHVDQIWDGRDQSGSLVPDGSYSGLVEIDLLRIKEQNGSPVEEILATANPTHAALVVDDVAPQIQLMASPPANEFGWNRTDVSVAFDATDDRSGVASVSASVVLHDEGAGQVVVGTALDRAGNSSSIQTTINIDKTAPSLTIDSPADGEFVIETPVQVDGTASDGNGLQGLLVCGGSTDVVGNAFSALCELELGSNQIVVTATDIADNSTTVAIAASLGRCYPGATEACYDGPEGTENVGACAPGERTCMDDGLDFGPCEGQVRPADETCNAVDDDCDGIVDSGLVGCDSIDELPTPDPDPCEPIGGECDSLQAGQYVIFSVPADGGIVTTAMNEAGDVMYVSWQPATSGIEVLVSFPDSGPAEPFTVDEPMPSLRQANVVTVAIVGLGTAGSSRSESSRDPLMNHAGCDVIDDLIPGFSFSCSRFGFCCDLHDLCIDLACRDPQDSGNVATCFQREAAYLNCVVHQQPNCAADFPPCSLACNACHTGVVACFVAETADLIPGVPSTCCLFGSCGQPQECILGPVVITDPEICMLLGFPAQGWGDPHYITFDQLAYDFQAVGEFVLVRSLDDDLEIQARTKPWGRSRVVAVHSALAMNVAGDRVGIYVDPIRTLRINGAVNDTVSGTIPLPAGGAVVVNGSEYTVSWPDGSIARVGIRGAYLNLTVRLSVTRQGWVEGLLGNFDGSRVDELAIHDGLPIGTSPSADVLYGAYADSWRVGQDGSLFDYADGETTETLTDRTFPGAVVTAGSLPADMEEAARQICEARGITDPFLLDACILDVGFTEETSFADDAMTIMAPEQSTNVDIGSLNDGGLRLQMYDTPSPAVAVQNGFDGLPPGTFTLTTSESSEVVTSAVVPVVNFPDTGYDQAAFYGVGPNGVVDAGSTPGAPQGDDISIQPPGGNDTFGGSFQGYIYLPTGGDVTFTVGIDDYFDLIVDDESVLRFLSVTNFRYFSVTVPDLPSGPVPIRLNFGENSGEANVVLIGAGGGLPGGVVPAAFLLHE